MVRIEELAVEDIDRSEKFNNLVGIAKDLFGSRVSSSSGFLNVLDNDLSEVKMYLNHFYDTINVVEDSYFGDAMELARKFEEIYGEDSFTVKKQYKESD